ncbi:uncharacterized protein HD556DRAFT_1303840 [Suillus plorans]|uniref:Uncharacterized protein n=1 Tax=Suillus plorans TaxID=116603 RepID=A0A9P7DVA7_9AGAM|nr:uncharacterized protein HD556DRAFT_1303840 [Suillus plorans]KAG1803842.1 hypothetical protein HD556DRAFT_1303840 [Suillus plorans]
MPVWQHFRLDYLQTSSSTDYPSCNCLSFSQCCNVGVDGVPRNSGGKNLPIAMKYVHSAHAVNIAMSSGHEREDSLLHLTRQPLLQPSSDHEAPFPQYLQDQHPMHQSNMSMPVDDLAAELFTITLTDHKSNSDGHHKLHITRALQAIKMQCSSRAEATLNVVESQIESARIQLSLATSRDVLQSIRNELFTIIKTLAKVKHKVSSIVSRRTRLETTCNEIQTLLLSKEDGLPVSSEPVEFDSSLVADMASF